MTKGSGASRKPRGRKRGEGRGERSEGGEKKGE